MSTCRTSRDVTLKALNHIDPERDIQFTLGPVDSLDHASRLPNYGSKMGIDATRKWPSEGFQRPWPDEILMDEETKALVDRKWKDLDSINSAPIAFASEPSLGLSMVSESRSLAFIYSARFLRGARNHRLDTAIKLIVIAIGRIC